MPGMMGGSQPEKIYDGKISGTVLDSLTRKPVEFANIVLFKRGSEKPLDGTVTDLSELRGKNTLLLFWDPATANCQFMVPDLKTYERLRMPNSPELVIVATGAEKDVRAVALSSPVLLDPHLASRAIFGPASAPLGLDFVGTIGVWQCVVHRGGNLRGDRHDGRGPDLPILHSGPDACPGRSNGRNL